MSGARRADDRLTAVRRLLLDWYATQARGLPWRTTRDPWRVLVSEVMLQQTQVVRVIPAWSAFLERFPTPAALAQVTVAEAVAAWKGLGYNRRAVNLHRAATAIVARHGGVVPDDRRALTALPGLGEYTARAVLTFAFERGEAPVDTNVGRVLQRALLGRAAGRSELQRVADRALPPRQAHAWSQGLMDLGATRCTARRPRCDGCPLATACAWQAHPGMADPAGGSRSGGRAQAPFAGSNRYHRGRLVDALRVGPVARSELARAAELDDVRRLEELTAALVDDGLAQWHAGTLRLPVDPNLRGGTLGA